MASGSTPLALEGLRARFREFRDKIEQRSGGGGRLKRTRLCSCSLLYYCMAASSRDSRLGGSHPLLLPALASLSPCVVRLLLAAEASTKSIVKSSWARYVRPGARLPLPPPKLHRRADIMDGQPRCGIVGAAMLEGGLRRRGNAAASASDGLASSLCRKGDNGPREEAGERHEQLSPSAREALAGGDRRREAVRGRGLEAGGAGTDCPLKPPPHHHHRHHIPPSPPSPSSPTTHHLQPSSTISQILLPTKARCRGLTVDKHTQPRGKCVWEAACGGLASPFSKRTSQMYLFAEFAEPFLAYHVAGSRVTHQILPPPSGASNPEPRTLRHFSDPLHRGAPRWRPRGAGGHGVLAVHILRVEFPVEINQRHALLLYAAPLSRQALCSLCLCG